MSKMAELDIEIQTLLKEGNSAYNVARKLDIPVSWVFETSNEESDVGDLEEYSPFVTLNS